MLEFSREVGVAVPDSSQDGDRGEDEGPQDGDEVGQPRTDGQVQHGEVGKTAIQIISASWCLLGGPTGAMVGLGWVVVVTVCSFVERFGRAW